MTRFISKRFGWVLLALFLLSTTLVQFLWMPPVVVQIFTGFLIGWFMLGAALAVARKYREKD